MTQEEKAKAYDEALKWMRELYPGLHGATKEDAEHYFPELRESEDERIIEEIKFAVMQMPTERQDTKERCIAWLEKQKEHFRDDTKMVEQKPEDDKDFEEWIDDWWKHNKVNNPDSYNKGDEIQFDERGFKNFCREIRNMYQQKPAEKQDYSGLTDLERAIHLGFLVAGVENVPVAIIKETANECKRIANENAEWSEEDEDMLNCCISSIEEAKENRYAYKKTDGDTSYDHEIDWLKSLRPVSKESLQPHWKPSEEQMDALKELIDDAHRDGWVTPGATELYEHLKKLGMKEEPEYYQHFDPDC